jgi:organic radical activating enzyme
MSGKYFPIKTETACQLKWNWSTIRLYTGITSSCHRVVGDLVTVDTFDSFHNTPKKLEDRHIMLNGKWPSGGCEYCEKIESAGGSSDRMFHLAIPDMSPPELENDISAVIVTPRIVEVYFDNICNMSCIYCWDGFSSQIQQENIKHGRFEKFGVVIDNRATKVPDIVALTNKFWDWMANHGSEVYRLNILGGEPFYQRQFDQCLDFLSTHKNPQLELSVISNLMVPSDRFKKYIDRIHQLVREKQIKRFDLTASIDCFGAEQEYVRYGLDLVQWKENFEYLVSQKWITLNINQTLSVLTIKTVPALLQYINQFRANREIGHYFGTTVLTHKFLHPEIFGPGYFDQDFDQILKNMPVDTWQQKEADKYMRGIQLQLNSSSGRDQESINQLGIFLTEIDRRRNLSWKKTFLWLTTEVENVV